MSPVMPKPTLTPAVTTYGSKVTISGTIPNKPGLVVTLAEQAYPFSGPIGPLGGIVATTNATGAYTFALRAEHPAAYGVTADGAAVLAASNITTLKVAPAVTAKAKRAKRHRFAVVGRYQPSIVGKVSLYRRAGARVGGRADEQGHVQLPRTGSEAGQV